MNEKHEPTEDRDASAGPALAASAGVIAGGLATSGPAMAAAGGGAAGLGAYGTGLGALIAAIGCEGAALGTLMVVAAGPILGGVIGYSGYRFVRGIVRKRRRRLDR